FYLGGYSFSERGPHQLLGYERDEFIARQAVVLTGAFERQIFARPLSFARRGFLLLNYNVAGVSDSPDPPYHWNRLHGFGAGVALDSVVGPLRLVGGWGEHGRFHFYLSLGPAF